MKRVILISITAISSLIISFFILFSHLTLYVDGTDKFYYQVFDEDEKKIFLIGSSFAGRINGTLVNEQISENSLDNYRFYNLAKHYDNPIKVKNSIENILYANPEIVFYSVPIGLLGYDQDRINLQTNPDKNIIFENDYKESLQIFDIRQKFQQLLGKTNFFNVFFDLPNPKILSLTIIKKIFTNDLKSTKLYPKYEDKPFFSPTSQAVEIMPNKLLKESAALNKISDKSETQYTKTNIKALKEIFDTLQNNNIKVVIIVPPHSKFYLEKYPDHMIQDFNSKLEAIGNEKSIKIYNLLDDYAEQEIWSNFNHVAINPKSMVYSKDVASIVIEEIKENAS